MSDVGELWAAELRLSCSDATVRAYVGALGEVLRHAGKDDPAQLVRGDVVAWLAQPHLSANTRAVYLRRIGAFARWADRLDLVDRVRVRPYRNPETGTATDAQVAAMFRCAVTAQDRALLLLLAGLGLRREEACAVRGEDVTDLHLTVRGKGGRVDRLPIDSDIRTCAAVMPHTGWWFPSTSGCGHLTGDGCAKRVQRLADAAEVGHVTPHMLRRWMATSMARGGAPVTSISRLLRHRSLATTMIYVRPDDRDLRDARRRLPHLWDAG